MDTPVGTPLQAVSMQRRAMSNDGADHRVAVSQSRWHSLLASARLPADEARPWRANHEYDRRDGMTRSREPAGGDALRLAR